MKRGDSSADPPTIPYPSRRPEPETLSPEGAEPDTQIPGVVSSRSSGIISDDPTNHSGAYAFGEILGRGGMGEVVIAHDRRIGRDVALKRLRSGSPSEEDVARFLREARIQARLDHPSIVPVYELARDAAGHPYFTMKRLIGVTLTDMLLSTTPTRQRLLRAFADVCRAVDFAHTRGIVHRDLKPSNILLGEFGDVYVIDWGVARVVTDAGSSLVTADIDTIEGSAPAGQVLGTPGYMSPEQFHDPEVDRPADVYALGAILFEILAGEPLHPRGHAAQASTLAGTTDLSPASRRPDRAVPPELDALCVAMLTSRPTSRPTARRCADRVEEFLDGDRDVTMRRTMAIELVHRARTAFDAGLRADAMRAASRALALDPQAEGAAEIVTTLMLEPPTDPPRELRQMLVASDAGDISRHARAAFPGYILIASVMLLIIANGVLDWSIVLGIIVSSLAMAVAARHLMKQPLWSFAAMVIYAIGNAWIAVLLGRLAGPFTFVPAMLSFVTASVITYPVFLERRWLLLGIMLSGFLVPLGLEELGVLRETWDLRDGGLISYANAMDVSAGSAVFVVILASIATILMAGIQSTRVARANREAQHRLVMQAWHLRQLLPQAAPGRVTS
jgi:serine/threonine-protein kinase